MSALAKLFRLEFNSVFLRSLLSLYYRPNNFYRIVSGPLRRYKIWYDRSVNYHAILGLWERKNFYLLEKVVSQISKVQQSLNLYDVGANIGLFSLFFSKFQPKAQIISFEAVPETVEMLKRNLKANAVTVSIVDKALSSDDGFTDFFISHHHKSSLLQNWASDRGTKQVGKITVETVKIDTYCKQNAMLLPDLVKIDVEGAGDKVLKGAYETIKRKRPVILFESHLGAEDEAVIEILALFSYKAYRINDNKWVVNEKKNYKDPDGVWGTMFLFPSEKFASYEKLLAID